MNNKKGYTLIEIIVTFMLISIFLLAATVVTTSCMKVYIKVKSISTGQTAADSIAEKINGELSAAQKSATSQEPESYCVTIDPVYESGSNSVTFVNDKGIKVTAGLLKDVAGDSTIATERGELLALHYYDKKGTDWYYGESTYHGFELTSLLFSRFSEESNVIRVDIVLRNPKTGYEFTTYKLVECYNLEKDDIIVVT